jgi:hypothetical protein
VLPSTTRHGSGYEKPESDFSWFSYVFIRHGATGNYGNFNISPWCDRPRLRVSLRSPTWIKNCDGARLQSPSRSKKLHKVNRCAEELHVFGVISFRESFLSRALESYQSLTRITEGHSVKLCRCATRNGWTWSVSKGRRSISTKAQIGRDWAVLPTCSWQFSPGPGIASFQEVQEAQRNKKRALKRRYAPNLCGGKPCRNGRYHSSSLLQC